MRTPVPKKIFLKNNKEFLSQIPYWEKEYSASDDKIINFTKKEFINAKASFTENKLDILGHAVMEDWETPYMRELAYIATQNRGTVLEVGFGMGISAAFIQKYPIDKHIIIEANKEVANKARHFAKTAIHSVQILVGLWDK